MIAACSSRSGKIEPGLLEGSTALEPGIHPWRRLIARLVDTAIYGLLAMPMLGPAMWLCVLFMNNGQWLPSAITLFSTLLLGGGLIVTLEAFLTSYWGGSLGKHLLGLRITDRYGEYLGYGTAFRRTLQVGGFMAIATLLTPLLAGPCLGVWQYRALTGKGYALWDAANHTRVGNPPVRDF